jgi:hypothetical protein
MQIHVQHAPIGHSDRRLHRSGWSTVQAGFTGNSGRYVHQVDGSNGEKKLRVEGVCATKHLP